MNDIDKLNNVVFFDGNCGLCHFVVKFLLKIDKKNILKYAPLQGETSKKIIQNLNFEELNTVMFFRENRVYEKSDAILEILKTIGGVWRLALIFKIIPRALRNIVYMYISRNRIKCFGRKDSCEIGGKSLNASILD